jgi:hypothetical protein
MKEEQSHTSENSNDDSQYMLRKEPKDPSLAEQFGRNRLSIGYEGKYVRSVMVTDSNGEYQSEEIYLKSITSDDEQIQ